MNANEELRQQLWELCYELLPTEERDALVTRIKSDPQVARLYAEVRLQSDLVGYAAQVEDSSLVLTIDGKEISQAGEAAPAAGRRRAASTAKPAPARGSAWGAGWLAASAAAVLLGLIGYGQFRPFASRDQMPVAFIVTEVEAPVRLQAGLSSTIDVRTMSVDRKALAADVDVRLKDTNGRELSRQLVQTSTEGLASIQLPGDKLEPGVRLEVQASEKLKRDGISHDYGLKTREALSQAAQETNLVTHELTVAAEPALSYTMLEKPAAFPGESVRFATVHFNRYSLTPAPATVGDVVVERSDGSPVVRPVMQVAGDLSQGEFQVPPEPALDALALPARDKDVQQRQRRAQLSLATTLQMGDDSRMLASGGGLRPQGSASRYAAGPTAAAPADPTQKQVEEKSADERLLGQEPRAALAKSSPAENRDADENRAAGATVLAAGSPVPIEVPAEYAEKKLQAKLVAGNKVVVSRNLAIDGRLSDGKEGETGLQGAAFSLPPELHGPVRVDLIDASQSPPQVVNQYHYYRESARQLAVDFVEPATGTSLEYAPGAAVKLMVRVVDENGAPAAASLGVRVWNEDLVRASDRQPPMLTDVLRRWREVSYASDFVAEAAEPTARLEDLAQREELFLRGTADGYAPAEPAPQGNLAGFSPANRLYAVRLSQSAAGGGEGELPAIADESLVVSNAAAVQHEFGRLAADFDHQQQEWRAGLGRVLVIGGVAALVLLGLLVLLRLPAKSPSSMFVLVAAAASLLFGMLWVGPTLHRERQVAAVPKDFADREVRLAAPQSTSTTYEAKDEAPAADQPTEWAAETYGMRGMQDYTESVPGERPATSPALAVSPDIALPSDNSPAPASETPAGHSHLLKEAAQPAEPAATPAPSELAPFATAPAAPAPTRTPAGGQGGAITRGGAGYGGGAPGSGTQAAGADAGSTARSGTEKALPLVKQSAGSGKSGSADERDQLAEVTGSDRSLEFKKATSEGVKRPVPAGPKPAASMPSRPQADRIADQPAATAPGASSAPAPRPAQAEGGLLGGGRNIAGGALSPEDARLHSQPSYFAPAAQPASPGVSLAIGAGQGAGGVADFKYEQQLSREARSINELASGAAPASLYFNPQLATDEQGYATVEFTLPPVQCEYRVLVDAFGNGRVGSAQALVVGRTAPAKEAVQTK